MCAMLLIFFLRGAFYIFSSLIINQTRHEFLCVVKCALIRQLKKRADWSNFFCCSTGGCVRHSIREIDRWEKRKRNLLMCIRTSLFVWMNNSLINFTLSLQHIWKDSTDTNRDRNKREDIRVFSHEEFNGMYSIYLNKERIKM